jgi:hypothetical protein
MKKRDRKPKRSAQERLDERLQVIRSFAGASDDTVMTFAEWCLINSLSPATGARIRKEGGGPEFVHPSAQRRGVTVRANREWQQARAR